MYNTEASTNSRPIVIYDGECGMCSSFVQFILKHEKTENVRFTPTDSQLAISIINQHFGSDIPDSIIYINGDKILTESSAAIEISKELKWPFQIVRYIGIIPRSIRDIVYRFIAKRRKKIFDSSPEACKIGSNYSDRIIY